MSRNYFHTRWNDQNWTDDGDRLRRVAIPFGEGEIGASIAYWFYEKSAKGSIDFRLALDFGGYHLSMWAGQSLREYHGPRCVPNLKRYTDQFLIDNYPLICRWYYQAVLKTIWRDTDPENPRFIPNLDPADVEAAYEYLKTIDQAVKAVEKDSSPRKRSGQMTISAEA